MSTEIHSEAPRNQLSDTARDIAKRASEAAKETAQRADDASKNVADAGDAAASEALHITTDAAQRGAAKVKELYHSARLKAGDSVAASKDYVRRNPVPAIVGAIGFGAAIAGLLLLATRKATFSERYADDPVAAVREAALGALEPVAHTIRGGYDVAREGATKAIDRVPVPGRNGHSLAHRVGSSLKFW